jgi:hypothetical protein
MTSSSTGQNHYSSPELSDFLQHKHSLSQGEVDAYKDHIDNCHGCWSIWNEVRWRAAEGSQGLAELEEYMASTGEKFIKGYDSSWAIAYNWFEKSPQTDQEIANFYKQNDDYPYNLVVWHESGDREPYADHIAELVSRYQLTSAVDFGCGVGTDGLEMMNQGMEVVFVDFECPSSDFLKWRLKKRGLKAEFINTEQLEKLPEVEMFWAIDVLEHMPDPLWTVHNLSDQTKVYAHRSPFSNTHSGRHPCHLPFNELKLAKALTAKGFVHVPWKDLSVWVREK